MNARRQGNRLWLVALSRLFRPLEGKAWLTSATLVFCSVVGLTTYHLWHQHADRILSHPQYRLKTNRLRVTPQPEWIRSDVVQSAVTQGRLHDANLLDKEMVLQVKQAFGVQPWVRKVIRVNKRYPSTVEVDLEYRRPLAMVEVPAGMFPDYNYEGLLPIDAEGYLLPVEISEQEALPFPKIAGVDSSPTGPAGNPWGDPRVGEAAQIIALLEDVWQTLELAKVEVPPRASPAELSGPQQFTLVTRGRRRFNWGAAPGQEAAGDKTATEKAAGLRAFAEQHGALDRWQETAAPSVSDLLDHQRLRR
jgi:hypothetical protein